MADARSRAMGRLRRVLRATANHGPRAAAGRRLAHTASADSPLPEDPLSRLGGLRGFGAALREGRTSAADVTADYLRRIAALQPKLQCFELVLADEAAAAAKAIDDMLAAGTDLG